MAVGLSWHDSLTASHFIHPFIRPTPSMPDRPTHPPPNHNTTHPHTQQPLTVQTTLGEAVQEHYAALANALSYRDLVQVGFVYVYMCVYIYVGDIYIYIYYIQVGETGGG